jgi:glutamyl-Q tRNA(Asp) synthetase
VAQHPNEKLSKQHRSPAIDDSKPIDNVRLALQYLGVKQEKLPICPNITELLDWAIANWSLKLLPKQSELLISVTNDVYSATENMLTSR